MARRPRTMNETFYDYFADQPVAEQVLMLQTLQEINRQARRGKLNGKKEPAPQAHIPGCACAECEDKAEAAR